MTAKSQPPTKIEWEEPPLKETRQGSKWDPIAKALRARPGKWACLGRNVPTSIVTDINRGTLRCWKPEGSFEAVTRNHTDRWMADVYARYIGDDQEHAEAE